MNEDTFVTGEAEKALQYALALPIVSLPFAVLVIGGAIVAVRRKYWTAWGRVHYLLFALAVALFILQLHVWNLLGWRI